MDSSKSIAEVHDEAVALHARIVQRHQSIPLSVNQKAKWSQLELLSVQSREYLSAWRVQGIQGLTNALRDLAHKEKLKGSTSNVWTEILRDTPDSNTGSKTKLYLASMHPMLVEALILGDITKRLYENDNKFEAVLRTAELDDGPGTYINVLCRRKYVFAGGRIGGTRESQWPGYSLSVPELVMVLQDCADYLRYTDSETKELADEVDNTVRDDAYKKGPFADRRFLPSPRSLQVIREWIEAVKKRIVVPARAHVRGRPLEKCFYEIGIGHHCKKRANDHQFLSGSNYLFALVVSVVHRRFPETFEVKAYQLHRFLEAGDQSLSEMELTLLGGALYTDGGLNVRHGGSSEKTMAQLPQSLYDRNLQKLVNLKIFELSWDVDEQKRKAFSAAVDAALALPRLKQDVEAMEADVQAKAKDMMTKVSGLVEADRARRNVLDSIQKWHNLHPAVPRQEVLRQNDEGNTASFVSDEDQVSYMGLTAATTPASCGRIRSIAEDDDESAQPRKRARVKDSSPEL